MMGSIPEVLFLHIGWVYRRDHQRYSPILVISISTILLVPEKGDTFLNGVEPIFNAALVGDEQQPALSLRHTTGLFVVLGQRPVRNASAEHKMFRIEGVIISRPAFVDRRRTGTARLGHQR